MLLRPIMKSIDKRRKQVLIIECDSHTLKNQNLAIGNEIEAELQSAFPKNGIDLIRAVEKSVFEIDLDSVLGKYRNPCKAVIMVGHGNESGIRLTADHFISWHDLGLILKPFAPQQLLFLACRAGNISACEVLFDNIPSLQHIFASPVNIPKSQQFIVIQKVKYALGTAKENQLLVNLLQGISALITKDWMFNRTREEHEFGELGQKEIIEKRLIMLTDWFKNRSNGNSREFSRSKTISRKEPLDAFVGAIRSGVPDWADNHDKYLGEELARNLSSK